MSRQTQGDYRYLQKLAGTKQRLKNIMTKEEFKVLEKYEIDEVKVAHADATRVKNFDMIWSLTKMLNGKSWLDLNQEDIDSLVITIMNTHGNSGKETATSSDHKRFLKIWYRFVKLGSRSWKEVGDPIETKGISAKSIYKKLSANDMITWEETKKIIDSCTNLRDKALVHTVYDLGKRIGEILNIKIKDIQATKNGFLIKTDGKTGVSTAIVLECLPTLSAWLESHPNSDDPEAWLFPNMKHIWKGSKYSYESSDRMLKRSVKVAGIKRKIYWHLFRHSAATRSAKFMTDAIIKDRFAWSPTSKMPARYTHLNVGVDANNAYLKAHGIEPESEDEVNIMPVLCPICNTPNNHDQKFCQKCAKPMSTEMAVLLNEEKDEKIEKLENSVESLTSMMLPILELLNSTQPMKIPLNSFPKSVQQQLEKKLNQK